MPGGVILVGGSNPHRRYNFSGKSYPTELSLEVYQPYYLGPQYAEQALDPHRRVERAVRIVWSGFLRDVRVAGLQAIGPRRRVLGGAHYAVVFDALVRDEEL